MIAELILLVFLGIAAIWDRIRFSVPNRLVMIGCGVGIAIRLTLEEESAIFLMISGAVLPFILCLPLFAMSMIGAGDVKLFMMTGIYLGPRAVLFIMLVSCLLGAAEAVIRILHYSMLRERFSYLFRYFRTVLAARTVQPYIPQEETDRHAIWLMHFAVHIFLAALICCLVRGKFF